MNTTPRIVSRDAARAAGLTHYFSGTPCTHGHISPRFVSTCACATCSTIGVARRRNNPLNDEQKEDILRRVDARGAARAANIMHYFLGTPCKRGHISKRWTSNAGCVQCGLEQTDKWRKHNPPSPERKKELSKRSVAWAKANPDKVRQKEFRERLRKYGLSEVQFAALKTRAGGRCVGCGSSEPKRINWQIDHDHKTGFVRGLICGPCNLALGGARDNPETLRRLADYLDQNDFG